uniref:N-acetylmuramoyl-L-alanine amidase n=1 Tax=Salsuginibacillus kocurii TaxID=427078 RepID=UPI000363B2D0|nr:N-acetylmuramoyl-L-alanine amidase [Salsuginibacillus kocurii]
MEVIEDFIPVSNSNRPQTALVPTHITVHETSNTSVGANAEVHASYVKGSEAEERQISWHYTVDDTKTIQHLPTNEIGWHAGPEGNSHSVGIELCVNQDGNFQQTRQRAIALIQHLLEQLSVSNDHVVTHYFWTTKTCPANLLNNWDAFLEEITDDSNDHGDGPSPVGNQLRVIVDSLWVYDAPDWDARYTTVSRDEVFTVAEVLTVNGTTMYQLQSGLYITGNLKFVELIT